jgi:hypothetical protein
VIINIIHSFYIFIIIIIIFIARVRRHDDISLHVLYLSDKYGETRNSCLLSVESGKESRHLVFRSLETLTGLKDQVRELIA